MEIIRTYWNLQVLLSWPDPRVVDPCDNLGQFPGVVCTPDGSESIITTLYPFNFNYYSKKKQKIFFSLIIIYRFGKCTNF